MLCHLITGLRQFYNHMSSVTYYHIIGAFFATLCVHDILYFTFRSIEVLIRSVRALIRSTEVLIRSAGALIRTGVLCHLITGLRQFYNHMSSVTYYHIIGVFFATLCVHNILYFTFMVMCQFIFILYIIFMFHEHIYAFCIFHIFHVTITCGISYSCTV